MYQEQKLHWAREPGSDNVPLQHQMYFPVTVEQLPKTRSNPVAGLRVSYIGDDALFDDVPTWYVKEWEEVDADNYRRNPHVRRALDLIREEEIGVSGKRRRIIKTSKLQAQRQFWERGKENEEHDSKEQDNEEGEEQDDEEGYTGDNIEAEAPQYNDLKPSCYGKANCHYAVLNFLQGSGSVYSCKNHIEDMCRQIKPVYMHDSMWYLFTCLGTDYDHKKIHPRQGRCGACHSVKKLTSVISVKDTAHVLRSIRVGCVCRKKIHIARMMHQWLHRNLPNVKKGAIGAWENLEREYCTVVEIHKEYARHE